MNALFRKELRQILPAQLLLTTLFTVAWFALVDPEMALAPYSIEQFMFYPVLEACCLLVGLVLGLAQFGMERWQGTEAYLVHRGTGRRGAFRAKVLAGLASLMPLALVPPTVFGAYHLYGGGHAGSSSVLSLVQAAFAGLTVVPGHALGVFVAQVRRGWMLRLTLALLGALTLLFALTLLAYPLGMFGRWPFAWHLSIASTGAWLLFLAERDFEAGGQRVRSRRVALLHALTAAALCLPFFIVVPQLVITSLRIDVVFGLPHVVEDEQGRLFVATRTERDREALLASHPDVPRGGWVFDLVDARGDRVPDELGLHYNGPRSFFQNRPEVPEKRPTLTTLYAPYSTALTPLPEALRQEDPLRYRGPLALTGPWHEVEDRLVILPVLVDLSDGALWVRGRWSSSPRSWRRLATLGPSIRVLEGTSATDFVLCDLATGRLRTLRNEPDGVLPVLEDTALPDGDHFVGIEPLYDANAARIGLTIPGNLELVRGSNGLYARGRAEWLRWEDLGPSEREGRATADELEHLRRWTLVPSHLDGTSFHLDVLDAGTGDSRLAVDLAPTTQGQRNRVRLAEAACLALPPGVALASWCSPPRPAPELWMNLGATRVDELRGRNRTWVVAASLLVAAVLTRNLWRRLGQGGAAIELRLLWCGATALLGLPAYVLCRLLEPRAARAPHASAQLERREPRFVIRTA